MLGRLDWAESDCREALAAFRAMGEAWGTAAVLIQLAEFARLRGDHAAAVAALEEASALGKQLGAWGDLSHIGGKLAAVRLRAGDLAGARADLERAEREEAARGIGQSDAATWLGAAHAVRGCFDEGSLDAPAVRDAARARLSADEFEAAYERGRCLSRDDALALAAGAVANPVTAG
jgi:hypothetical protein